MVYHDLIFNLTLLVTLVSLSGLIDFRFDSIPRFKLLLQGVLFGAFSALGMLYPLYYTPGVIFDGRSVILSLCALFFGTWPALIASMIAAMCRMVIGGTGTLTGLLTILASAGIGLLVRFRHNPTSLPMSVRSLYLFGVAVTLAVIALMFTLPGKGGRDVVKDVSLSMLLLYPLATILIGKTLLDQVKAKKSLEALRTSERIFNKFIEYSPVHMFFKDDKLRVLKLSSHYVSMLGKPIGEILGKTMDELFPSDLAKRLIESDKRVLLEGKPIENEEEIDGRFYSTIKFPIFFENQSPCIGGFTIDVTERKLAELELCRTNKFLNSIIDNVPNMLLLKSAKDLRFVRVNPAGEDLLGYSQAELVGKNDYDFFSKDQADFFIEKDREVLRSQKIVDIPEEPLLHREKGLRILHTRKVPLMNEKKEPVYLMAVSEDITEKKKAIDTIMLNEARLESLVRIIEHSSEKSIQDLLDTTLDEAIALTGSIIGYIYFYDEAKEEFSLNSWSRNVMSQCSVVHPQTVYQLAKTGIWGEAVRQRQPIIVNDFSASNPLKKGLPHGHVSLQRFLTIPVFDEGVIVAVVGVANKQDDYNDTDIRQLKLMMDGVWNIIQRKQVEEAQAKAQVQLIQIQKMESIGRLASGIAHDYNNMLSIILGHAQLALDKTRSTDPLYEDLEGIFEAAVQSVEFNKQLLSFASQQSDQSEVLSLNESVRNIIDLLQPILGMNINVTQLLDADLWPVKMSHSQLNQIIMNLCINARDAFTGPGQVTIETNNVTLDAAFCQEHIGLIPGEYVLLAVSDNACGISKECLGQIFEPFFTTKEKGQGTGLGLATVYGLVKQNNGAIDVFSEPGKGTTFKIYFPRCIDLPVELQEEQVFG